MNLFDYLPNDPLDEPRILIFTGSGISAESGLKTYRADDGLWENEKIDKVCNEFTWQENYQPVHDFYNGLRNQLSTVHPNPAHQWISQIQQEYGDAVHIVTQNIDNLLERAGCNEVLHLHGSLTELECISCLGVWEIGYEAVTNLTHCPYCLSTQKLKPNIVFFGSQAPMYAVFYDLLDQMYHPERVVIVSGTSGNIININEFIKDLPCKKVLNNLEQRADINEKQFDQVFYEPASMAWKKIKTYLDETIDWII